LQDCARISQSKFRFRISAMTVQVYGRRASALDSSGALVL
jgi:hypothetical protein